jgi:FKBP-type peptidyl-prolyl cis-trans isomerase FklB
MKRLLAAAGIAALSLSACSPQAASDQSLTERFPAKTPDQVAAEGKAFLEKNKTAQGVQVTPSGLQYKIVKSGPEGGAKPTAQSVVRVHYEGKLLDGTVFDSSYARNEPASFPVGGLIPAWVEALQMMKPGDVWEIWAPPEIAYGPQGAGPIPPNSVLHFRMELLEVAG